MIFNVYNHPNTTRILTKQQIFLLDFYFFSISKSAFERTRNSVRQSEAWIFFDLFRYVFASFLSIFTGIDASMVQAEY
jgi:hypothetical protein